MPVEAAVFLAGDIERLGKRVEAVGEDGKLLDLRRRQARRVMAILQPRHAAGQTLQRIEHAAEHDIEHHENERVEGEPDDGERIEVLPGFGDFVGWLADDDHRVDAFGGYHPHRAPYELRAHKRGEPVRGMRLGALIRRRHDGELARGVHEHDADVAKMLELQRQKLFELFEMPLRGEILDGGVYEALGDFKRRLDFDARRRAGVEDRNRHRHDGGEKVDQPYRDKKLGADRPIVPEFLQHLIQSPTGWAGKPIRHIS